jgi:hypothetical protein
MTRKLKELEARGLAASIYTQITDVESEQNGLMTYDRITKIPVAELAKINAALVPRAMNYVQATAGFAAPEAGGTPEATQYEGLLSEYRAGGRDLRFLKRAAILAMRQNDQPHATEIGNEYLARVPQPYAAEVWEFIYAATRTSKDRGFAALREHPAEANRAFAEIDSVLAPRTAEGKVREVIYREEIEPSLKDTARKPDWAEIEQRVSAKYGALGAEEVAGRRMLAALEVADWKSFGHYYVRYFTTAAHRSEYPLGTVSYAVFENVTDRETLESAIRVMGPAVRGESPDLDTFGAGTATQMDTYANLLYKAGRTAEALEWQHKANERTQGRDPLIAENLAKMKAGKPTWIEGLP